MRKYAILLPYKHTEDNGLELKHAIRSWEKNFKVWDGTLFIVGDKEEWFGDKIIHIPYEHGSHEDCCNNGVSICYANVYRKLSKALADKRIPEHLFLMNDDFFINKPVTNFENMIGDRLRRQEGGNMHLRSKTKTGNYLRAKGYTDYSFELHIPLLVKVSDYIKATQLVEHDITNPPILMGRSLYGNIYLKPKLLKRWIDQKTYDETLSDDTYVSTNYYINELAKRFDKPSTYERLKKPTPRVGKK